MKLSTLNKLTCQDIKEIVSTANCLLIDKPKSCNNSENDDVFYTQILYTLMKMANKIPCSERCSLLIHKAEEATGLVLTSTRNRDSTCLRTMVAYRLYREGYSLSEIGRSLQRNHSSISHLCQRMNDMLSMPMMYSEELKMNDAFEALVADYDEYQTELKKEAEKSPFRVYIPASRK